MAQYAIKEYEAYHHAMMHGTMMSSAHTVVVVHVCAVNAVRVHMSVMPMTVIHVAMVHQSIYNHTTQHCQLTTVTVSHLLSPVAASPLNPSQCLSRHAFSSLVFLLPLSFSYFIIKLAGDWCRLASSCASSVY